MPRGYPYDDVVLQLSVARAGPIYSSVLRSQSNPHKPNIFAGCSLVGINERSVSHEQSIALSKDRNLCKIRDLKGCPLSPPAVSVRSHPS